MATYFSPYDSIPSETVFGDFSGQDVDGWLCQIENFFDRYLMAPEQRLAVIHNYLAEEATYWHYEMYMSRRLTTWESFVTDLRHRFKPTKTLINQQEVIEEPDVGAIDLSTIVAEEPDGDKETEIVAVADTEVTSGIYSAEFSSMLVLNDAEISEECLGTKFCSVKNTLSSCLPPICENDSVKVLSLFVTKIWCCIQPFVIATKPPPKPPEASLNMLGQINQVLSIASKVSCDMFKSIRFPGSSKKDAASTKCLVFVSWFISVYIIELSRFHLPLTECVKSGVSALLDVVALVGSIDEYGICITVGLKNGDKDEISCYFRHMGNNHWPFAIVVRSESKLLCSIKLERATGNTLWFSRLQTNAIFNELCKMFDLGEPSFVPQKEKGSFVMFVNLQGSGKAATWTRYSYYHQKIKWKTDLVFAAIQIVFSGCPHYVIVSVALCQNFSGLNLVLFMLTNDFMTDDIHFKQLQYTLCILEGSAEKSSYEWRWQMMSLRVNRGVSGGNHPPNSDFNVAVGMARDGAAVTHHDVELELVVSSENNLCGAFSAENGDHIETSSGYRKMFSAICPTSITHVRSMQPFTRFSMGITYVKLRTAAGLTYLETKKHELVANKVLQTDIEWGNNYSELIAPRDIAAYARLCALVSFGWTEMKNKGVNNSNFKTSLEFVTEARELVNDFFSNHYTSSLEYSGDNKSNLLLDINQNDHVKTLYDQVHEEAVIQCVYHFMFVDMRMRANACRTTIGELKKEIEALITDNQTQARIDPHIKVIFKRNFAWNLLASVFTRRREFLMFSLPRPPEVNDLEDKVVFKGRRM